MLCFKVENLQALLSLKRLFLDNNLIERISGLDKLVHLEWLDLSFNRIRKIEGYSSQSFQYVVSQNRLCIYRVGQQTVNEVSLYVPQAGGLLLQLPC